MLTPELFERLQALSRLRLPEGEVAQLMRQLEDILGFVHHLESVGSMEKPATAGAPFPSMREDVPAPGLDPAEALRAAPARSADLFRVPLVLPRETP